MNFLKYTGQTALAIIVVLLLAFIAAYFENNLATWSWRKLSDFVQLAYFEVIFIVNCIFVVAVITYEKY